MTTETTQTQGPRLEVVEMDTDKVVHVVPLKATDDRYVERVMSGLLRNMDTDRYFVREVLA